MPQPPVLDTAVLAELREIMGADFETLVQSYVRDGNQRLQALHQALADSDAETVRQQAHSFKGSSGNLGALRVTATCLDIEQYARDGDLAAAGLMMEALENHFQQSCQALQAL